MYKEIEGRHFGCIVCNRITLPLCHLGPPRHAFLLHSPISANQQSRPHVETSRSHQKGGGRHHEQPYQWHPSYLFLSGYNNYRNLLNIVVIWLSTEKLHFRCVINYPVHDWWRKCREQKLFFQWINFIKKIIIKYNRSLFFMFIYIEFYLFSSINMLTI